MTNQHPISVPDELLRQWCQQIQSRAQTPEELWRNIANTSAQWAADQELEACCEWLRGAAPAWERQLRTARRPKPPSLKEQALEALKHLALIPDPPRFIADMDTIRQALEALPND